MKLQQIDSGGGKGAVDLLLRWIYEQSDGGNERGDTARESGTKFQRNGANAGRIEHEAQCVGSCIDRDIDVLFITQSANFDACSSDGNGRI